MAISNPTLLFSTTGSTGSGGASAVTVNNYTTGSFTPPSSSLLIAFLNVGTSGVTTYNNTSVNAWSFATTGLTWNNILGIASANNTFQACTLAAYALVGTGTAITANASGFTQNAATQYIDVDIYSVNTGYNSSTPIGKTGAVVTTSNGLVSITLSGTPLSSSVVIADATLVPVGLGGHSTTNSSWTNTHNNADSSGACLAYQDYITGITTSTITPWTVLLVGDSVNSGVLSGIEILATGAAAAVTNYNNPFTYLGMV